INLSLPGIYRIQQAPANTNVVGTFINDGGAGYFAPPTVTFSPPGPGGTQATGFATIGNGEVTGIFITNAGSGYTTAPTITLTGGSGTPPATATAIVGETANLAGELAISPSGDLTVQNTSGGKVTVDAGSVSRVLDINPNNTNNPATHFTVTLQGFTISGG